MDSRSDSGFLNVLIQMGEALQNSGAEIYRAAMPLVAKLYLTRVHAQINGDVEMPPWGSGWKMLSEEFCEKGERDDFSCTFQVLVG